MVLNILMSLNVREYVTKSEVTTINGDILQYIRVFTSQWESMWWEVFYSVKQSKTIRENMDQPFQCWIYPVDAQQNKMNGHDAKQFCSVYIS